MKTFKRMLALLLCMVMALSCLPVTGFAADGAANIYMEPSASEVNVGDTFTVCVSYDAMKVATFISKLRFDKDLVEMVSALPCDPEIPDEFGLCTRRGFTLGEISTIEQANNSGVLGFLVTGTSDVSYVACDLYTVTFRAKSAGTAAFTLEEDSDGTDGFSGVAQTASVTIKAAATCEHTNTEEVSNGNGTHNIVCTDENCGETVTENVPCTEDTRKESVSEADCDTAATFVDITFCTECGAELRRSAPYTEGNSLGHTWGTIDYSWSADNAACEAVRECTVDDCGVKETAEAEVSSSTTPATCENPEKVVYTATFTEDWAKTQSKEVTGTTTEPHQYFYACDAFCMNCGELTNPDAAHSLTHVAAKAGTDCQTWDGNIEYWTCEHCGGCWDNANAMGMPLNRMTIKAAGPHSYFYECDGFCQVCGELTNSEAAHNLTHVPAQAGTDCQTWDGNVEYWTCSHCNGCWDNANAMGMPLNRMTIKAAGPHSYFYECDGFCQVCGELTNPEAAHNLTHVPAKAGTDCQTWDGNVEYWTCSHCNGCWDNANAMGMPLNRMTIKAPGAHSAKAVDNGDGTHKIVCGIEACGETMTESEAHDYTYNAEAHKCVCGKVEEFTLTVYAMQFSGDDTHTSYAIQISVPYGAKLADYIPTDCGAEWGYAPIHSAGDQITVSGTWYEGVFTVNSWMLFDTEEGIFYPLDMETATMPNHDLEIDQDFDFNGWEHCFFNEQGELVNDRQGTYYQQNGELLAGWNEIDGNWYYFDTYTHYRAEGLSRVPYPVDNNGDPMEVDGNIYAPNAEDLAYAAEKEITFIDAEEGWFLFGSDGKFQSTTTGMGTYNEATRWVENGHIAWHPGMVKVDGDYYYFLGDEEIGGNILAVDTMKEENKNEDGNYDIYVSRADNASLDRKFNKGYYTFGEWGGMQPYYGMCNYANFTKFRFYGIDGADKNRLMCGLGLYNVSSEDDPMYIYVRGNGECVKGQIYWVSSDTYGVVPGLYSFDDNGYMLNPVSTRKDGIYWENGGWFLYDNGKRVYNKGLMEVTETWHDGEGEFVMTGIVYVRSNGLLAMGDYYATNVNHYTGETPIAAGTKLRFDNYGTMVPVKNGIVAENDSLYYYVNNVIAYNAGVVELDGNYYYVRSNGEVVHGCSYWITNVGDTGVIAKEYTFDENGVMQNPQTTLLNGIVDGYYYVNGKIAYGAGVVELEDGAYIYVRSNGKIAIGLYWVTNTNGKLAQGQYDFGNDGKYYA